jgi:hypothetical protein
MQLNFVCCKTICPNRSKNQLFSAIYWLFNVLDHIQRSINQIQDFGERAISALLIGYNSNEFRESFYDRNTSCSRSHSFY